MKLITDGQCNAYSNKAVCHIVVQVVVTISAPPPLPPGLGSGGVHSKASMRVKRMNWEKIDKIEENTVWAKVSF